MENYLEFQITKDGSPTARHLPSSDNAIVPETMHHRNGALSETIYVFGPAIQWGLEKSFSPQFLSIGLGLGYLEFLIAAKCLIENEPNKKRLSEEFYLESFESDLRLSASLINYLNDQNSDMKSIYDLILYRIEEDLDVNPEDICNLLLEAYDQGSWVIRSVLEYETLFKNKFNVILYDLYSSKTTESLWTQEFLNHFLKNTTDINCAFATYSSKGNLKRALKNHGFKLVERPGFDGKRESTLAFRN